MRVLVVDDDIMSRAILSRLLVNLGYQPAVAESGLEALRQLAYENFDLVLMDCHMPDMDGYVTTKMIRSPFTTILNPSIPVIALTADEHKGTMEHCISSGMDEYLTNPVGSEQLRTAICRCMNKS